MDKVKISIVIWEIVLVLLFVSLFVNTMHGETTGKRKDPLETFEISVNPYTYLFALPIEGQILEGKYTNIRFWPYGSPELFDQTVLFCGDVTPAFDGKRGPLVITYRLQGSHMYRGLSCHELLSVFEVPVK